MKSIMSYDTEIVFLKFFFNKENEEEFLQFRNNEDLAKVTSDNKHDKEFRYSGHIYISSQT